MARIDEVLEDRPESFRLRRDAFSDPQIFELELRRLFEGGWVFLAHESQLPHPHDFVTTHIGRRPVVLMRDADGEVRVFHNACPHRGSPICNTMRGNARVHVCPFHSWAFESNGRLRGIKDRDVGAYTERFFGADHGLVPIPRFESHRGFHFGSLNPQVSSLADYLGEAGKMLDLVVEQGRDGIEYVDGTVSFTYEGNWKAQLENCSDAYHVTSVHSTYIDIAKRRMAAKKDLGGVWSRLSGVIEEVSPQSVGGSFGFKNGHVVTWGATPIDASHPLFENRDEILGRLGPVRGKWVFYARNLTIFPNLQVAEGLASQVRVIRPLTPDRTEMVTYCYGPKGESPSARCARLRQYEDFFMPSGLATPDDLVVYELCQTGHLGADDLWLEGYQRGVTARVAGASEEAREIGLEPVFSTIGPARLCDETLFHSYYRAWRERLSEVAQEQQT